MLLQQAFQGLEQAVHVVVGVVEVGGDAHVVSADADEDFAGRELFEQAVRQDPALALGANATFVARSVDVYATQLRQVLKEAHAHRGTSFMQIFQNCNIFNDGAFESIREKKVRDDNLIELEHGKPLIFGKNRDKGIRWAGPGIPEVVELGDDVDEGDLVVHDERGTLGYLMTLAEMKPPAWMTRSRDDRSTTRSLITGKASARHGSIQISSPSSNLRMCS